MQIKSWHIALIGATICFIFPLHMAILTVNQWITVSPSHEGTSLGFFLFIIFFVLAGTALIPVAFLKNKKRKKIGAVLSIIFGTIQMFLGIVSIYKTGHDFMSHFLMSMACISGFFLFGAGVLYFWKETRTADLYKKSTMIFIILWIVFMVPLVTVIFSDDVKNYYVTNFIAIKIDTSSEMSAREILMSKLQEGEVKNNFILPVIYYKLPDITVCLYNDNKNLSEIYSVWYRDKNDKIHISPNYPQHNRIILGPNQEIEFYLQEYGWWDWGSGVKGAEIISKYDELLFFYDVGMNNAFVCDNLDKYNTENIKKIKILK